MAVSAGIFLAGLQWKIRLLQLCLYVLVPFIFMQCLCLGCMLTVSDAGKAELSEFKVREKGEEAGKDHGQEYHDGGIISRSTLLIPLYTYKANPHPPLTI